MVDIVIRSRHIFVPGQVFDGVIAIEGEHIEGIYPQGEEPQAEELIDATDLVVIPGLVDTHAHLRDPGFTEKEDFASGTRSAALGGVTTLTDMPNVMPPTSTVDAFKAHIENARQKSVVDFGHNAAGTDPDQIAGLADAGATAFKIFMMRDIGRDYPHMPGTGVHDHGLLYELFREIAQTGLVCMVHPHDQEIWDRFVSDAWERDDRGPEGYARAFFRDDALVFNSGVATALELQRATGVKLHLLHTVSKQVLRMARWARQDGQDVTLELNPAALYLGGSWENIERLGPYALGSWVPDHHVEALWEGMRNGEIDVIGTDHAPHTKEEKEEGWTDMFKAPGGSPNIQHYLSLLLTSVHEGTLSLRRVVELCSTNPAKRFGLYPMKGAIRAGSDADLVLVDLNREETISLETSSYKCGYNPYEGRVVKGIPTATVLRGSIIARDGEVLAEPGNGQFIADRLREQRRLPSPA